MSCIGAFKTGGVPVIFKLFTTVLSSSILFSINASDKSEVSKELYSSITDSFKIVPACNRYVVKGVESDVDTLLNSFENNPQLTTSREGCPLKPEEFVTQFFCRVVQEAHVTFSTDYFLHIRQIEELGDNPKAATQNLCERMGAEFMEERLEP